MMCFLSVSLYSPPPWIMVSGSLSAIMTPEKVPFRLKRKFKRTSTADKKWRRRRSDTCILRAAPGEKPGRQGDSEVEGRIGHPGRAGLRKVAQETCRRLGVAGRRLSATSSGHRREGACRWRWPGSWAEGLLLAFLHLHRACWGSWRVPGTWCNTCRDAEALGGLLDWQRHGVPTCCSTGGFLDQKNLARVTDYSNRRHPGGVRCASVHTRLGRTEKRDAWWAMRPPAWHHKMT